jgi:hypothetical protein
MVTSISLIRADTVVSGRLSFGVWTRGVLAAAMLSLGATMLVALEAPSKPFLEKNGF